MDVLISTFLNVKLSSFYLVGKPLVALKSFSFDILMVDACCIPNIKNK